MRFSYEHSEVSVTLDVERTGESISATLPDGQPVVFRVREVTGGMLEVLEGDRVFRIPYTRDASGLSISFGGVVYSFKQRTAGGRREEQRTESGELRAPMTGAVVDVLVSEGDAVDAYQPLVVIEAMKVLAAIEAPFASLVRKISVSKGDRVDQGALLVQLAPREPSED